MSIQADIEAEARADWRNEALPDGLTRLDVELDERDAR